MQICIALFLSVSLLFYVTAGRRTPVPVLHFEMYKVTETCPDECIYIEKCGVLTRKKEHDPERSPGQNRTVAYVAPGDGFCYGGYGLDNAYCPIKTLHDCLMKCGGDICATREASTADIPILPDLLKVYQILNDSSIDMTNSDRTWYRDYVSKHNENGTYMVWNPGFYPSPSEKKQ